MPRPMSGTTSKAALAIQYDSILNDATSLSPSSHLTEECAKHRRITNKAEAPFTLAGNPSFFLHVLSSCELDPVDLAALEVTCKFFRNPAKFPPDLELSLPELAAFDMCQQRTMFKPMKQEEKEGLKRQCGGSWKLVLRYILVGEKNYRRGKSQVVAGPGHSIVVTTKGDVYAFGANGSGQLGLGDTEDRIKPCLIRSLQDIRITQAAVGSKLTMLVSDMGSVYTFGSDLYESSEIHGTANVNISTPTLMESLKGVFVVQVSIGGYFSAVLSREGQVYTFSLESDERLGHSSDLTDVEPCLFSRPLKDVLVAQISAGNCYLLMLAYKPTGMVVYSVCCGLRGTIGNGSDKDNLGTTQLISYFDVLGVKPVSISAGAWHATALGSDGRVFTWRWTSNDDCLGDFHVDECMCTPRAWESLSNVKAVHVSAGENTTFVVGDNGDVYSHGFGEPYNLGFKEFDTEDEDAPTPKLVTSLAMLNERFVQISATNTCYVTNGIWGPSHTLALAESGRLYAFGGSNNGQLGVNLQKDQQLVLKDGQVIVPTPVRVDIELL